MIHSIPTLQKELHGDGDGNVTIPELVEWMESFMTSGSEQKEFRCGKESYDALLHICAKGQHGFFVTNEGVLTPYGRAKVVLEESLNPREMVARDTSPKIGRAILKTTGYACNVRSIS